MVLWQCPLPCRYPPLPMLPCPWPCSYICSRGSVRDRYCVCACVFLPVSAFVPGAVSLIVRVRIIVMTSSKRLSRPCTIYSFPFQCPRVRVCNCGRVRGCARVRVRVPSSVRARDAFCVRGRASICFFGRVHVSVSVRVFSSVSESVSVCASVSVNVNVSGSMYGSVCRRLSGRVLMSLVVSVSAHGCVRVCLFPWQ